MGPLDDINATAIFQVATAAGIEVLRGGRLARCPACNEEHRSSSDRRRGAATVTEGKGWHCHQCKAGGSPVDLLCTVLFGRKPPPGDPRWQEVIAFGAQHGWCAPPRSNVQAPVIRPAPPPAEVSAPSYPPADDVAAFWDACRNVGAVGYDDQALRWLSRDRGLNLRVIGDLDLARVIPDCGPWPTWLPSGRTDPDEWARSYRVVVPMFDVDGRLRSLRFRAIDKGHGGRKVMNPAGFGYAGLFMADPLFLDVLHGQRAGWDGRVVVSEGEPDYLTWATERRAFATPAGIFGVVGIASGSWTPELTERIPRGSTVFVDTHHDDEGNKYAERIINACRGHHRVIRSKCPEVPHEA